MPKTAITMGIGTIMKAKKIILLANGKKKAKIIKALLEGDRITTQLPVSMLLLHPNVTVILTKKLIMARGINNEEGDFMKILIKM